MIYITKSEDGRITAVADWQFPDSEACDKLPPVYAKVGAADQQIGGICPDGWVLMSGLCPKSCDNNGTVYFAGNDGEWHISDTDALRIRIQRNRLLSDCAWIVERHRDQLENGEATTLTDEQYQEWLGYRQALRDIPQQPGFPWDGPDDPACPWPDTPQKM